MFAMLSSPAFAHMKVVSPPPRSQADNIKSGPCGPNPKAAPQMTYTAGQQIKVDLLETIDHTGCYQVVLLDANDQNPKILAQKVDINDGPLNRNTGAPRDVVFTLPASTAACENCTLQVRQIMLENRANKECQPEQDIGVLGSGDVYFACSDVTIVAAAAGDAGVPDGGSVSVQDGGASSGDGRDGGGGSGGGGTAPTDGGVGVEPDEGTGGGRGTAGTLDDGGCRSTHADPSLLLLGVTALAAALGRRLRA